LSKAQNTCQITNFNLSGSRGALHSDVRCWGLNRPKSVTPEGRLLVESRCGAVALGRTYLLPPLSSGGASMVPPWLRFHIHRVAGGSRPPPAPTERSMRIYRTTLFGS